MNEQIKAEYEKETGTKFRRVSYSEDGAPLTHRQKMFGYIVIVAGILAIALEIYVGLVR